MRIAYVCADPGVPVFGHKGSSVHVREVVTAMLAQGAEVELFACALDGERPPAWESVRYHQLPTAPKGDLASREHALLNANHALQTVLQDAGLFDLIYERYSLWSHAAMEFAQDTGIPGVLEVNAPLIKEQARHRGLVDRGSAVRVAERVFSAATALHAVSLEVADYLRQYPAVEERVHVVPNGVNPTRFAETTTPTRPARSGVFTVGFLGTLKPWHGLDTLAEAFTLLSCHGTVWRLLVVGDGPERRKLGDLLRARKLHNEVEFTGAVGSEEVPGLLASMDVGVAPYPEMEDFYFSPLKVLEYMAAGLPVVTSRIGMLARLIEHEHNGLHCPPGDAGALADTLVRLKKDQGLRTRLGKQARATVLGEHTWDSVVRRIFRVAGIFHPAEATR